MHGLLHVPSIEKGLGRAGEPMDAFVAGKETHEIR